MTLRKIPRGNGSVIIIYCCCGCLVLLIATYLYANDWHAVWRRSGTPMLVLVTTMADLPERDHVHRNTIDNWAAHAPDVLPVLFLPPNSSRRLSQVALRATRTGWTVLPPP